MALPPERETGLDARVSERLDEAIAAGVCSAASVALGDAATMRAWWRGHTRRVPDLGEPVVRESPYDLASLTKPMATVAIALALISERRLAFDDRAARWLPVDGAITVAHLLGHAAGYPPHVELFRRIWAGDLGGAPDPRTALTSMAMTTPLRCAPGTAAAYSDLGFITLGALLERAAAAPLEDLLALVTEPLGLAGTRFVDLRPGAPRPTWAAPPVSTELDERRGLVTGEVHDENAHAAGGVAGHAGLFAPIDDVAAFARAMVRAPFERVGRFDPAVVAHAFATGAAPDTSWRLGWDTPSTTPGVSHAGDAWPRAGAVGHLGYTGTSMWLDLPRRRWVVLLANRVHPSRTRPEAALIKELRRDVGDLACALLDRGL